MLGDRDVVLFAMFGSDSTAETLPGRASGPATFGRSVIVIVCDAPGASVPKFTVITPLLIDGAPAVAVAVAYVVDENEERLRRDRLGEHHAMRGV